MKTPQGRLPIAFMLAAATVALLPVLTSAQAVAGSANSASQVETLYQQDRAACLSGTSHHDRSSCLREAAAVRAELRRDQRSPAVPLEVRERNALHRCADLSPEHQRICERMVKGEGQTSGSVEGGGVFRMLETEVVPTPTE